MSLDGRLVAGAGVLAAVIEARSFARAAEILGLSPSGVSRAIARLEARMGVRLLDRTTRSLSLTDEGRRFHEQVAPLLSAIEEAALGVTRSAHSVRGRLRVDVDPYFSRLVLAHRLGDFLTLYPDLSLDVVTRERMGDLVADGIDVAIRFGETPPPSAIGRKLLETRVVTVASPAYIKRHGRPEHPSDLARHTCIDFRDPATGRLFEWEFRKGRKVIPVETPGRLTLTDGGTLILACLAGTGIAQVLGLGIQEHIREGRLIDLFPDWSDETFPLYALYPSRHHAPAKVRAFIDFVQSALR